MQTDKLAQKLADYVTLCACEYTSPQEAANDFFAIASRPFTTGLNILLDREHPMFVFQTKHVSINFNGYWYRIGAFRAAITFIPGADGRNVEIVVLNHTPVGQDGGPQSYDKTDNTSPCCQHPHINDDGYFCIDVGGMDLYYLAYAGKLKLVVDAIWTGLNGYNERSPFMYIEAWPKHRKNPENRHEPDTHHPASERAPRDRLAVANLRDWMRGRGQPRLAGTG